MSDQPPDRTQAMLGTASGLAAPSPTPPTNDSPVTDEDLEETPSIEPAPDADVCGSLGCTTSEGLVEVRNVKDNPRIVCESCRRALLSDH